MRCQDQKLLERTLLHLCRWCATTLTGRATGRGSASSSRRTSTPASAPTSTTGSRSSILTSKFTIRTRILHYRGYTIQLLACKTLLGSLVEPSTVFISTVNSFNLKYWPGQCIYKYDKTDYYK